MFLISEDISQKIRLFLEYKNTVGVITLCALLLAVKGLFDFRSKLCLPESNLPFISIFGIKQLNDLYNDAIRHLV